MSFLAPKAPTPAKITTPNISDASVQAIADETRRKAAASTGGRTLTMLGASDRGFTQGFSTGTAKLLGATA